MGLPQKVALYSEGIVFQKGVSTKVMTLVKKSQTLFICEPTIQPDHPLDEYLIGKGFNVRRIGQSDRAVDEIIKCVPDLVLLDPHFPPAGGFEVCRSVRSFYGGPILFIGQGRDETAQLFAFECGADDYVLAPLSPALLTARIRVHLRHHSNTPSARSDNRRIEFGELVVDASRREVLLAGRPINLTTVQFDLLWYLARRSGRVVSREELYETLYKQEYRGFDRALDVYISRIRQQLGDSSENPAFLKTVRGKGYLFIGSNN
jgi:two-component system, OmpR family, response regulator RstA